MRRVTEAPVETNGVTLHVHQDWSDRFAWLVQGTTGRGFDLGLFGTEPVGESMRRWRMLREAAGCVAAVHARQVHETRIQRHDREPLPGLHVGEGFDGHVTVISRCLLAVSVADCVPVFLIDARRRAVAALHAGWRGAAAGMVQAGVRTLVDGGGRAADLWLHAGPAICGECYEVGPEVHEALGLPVPARNTPVDVRAVVARRAAEAGIPDHQISVSSLCTKCSEGLFYSHRGGDRGRQMGVIAVRGGE